MKWLVGVAIGYAVIGLAVGAYALWAGTTLKEAVFTGAAWPLSAIFVIGMLGR